MKIYPFESLNTSEDQHIDLGRLPEGKYTYHLAILNPFKNYFEIVVEVAGKFHTIFLIKEALERKNINFLFEAHPDKETIINLRLKKGEFLFVKPAICPQAHVDVDIEDPLSRSLLIPDIVNPYFVHEQNKREAIAETYRPLDVYARIFKEVRLQNESESKNGISKSSEVFYEFIDMETSRKQLDYVVFKKILKERKGNYFKRIIRLLIRKIFITTYRILTHNENRKNYIVKLYRNYVNMNYLSERKRK